MASVVLGVVMLAGISGCAAPEVLPTPSATATSLPVLPAGEGIAESVRVESSTVEPGTTVTARGSIELPKGIHGDAVVSISWIDSETSTVYARGVAELDDLTPGERREWEVSAELQSDAVNVRIVTGAALVKK